MESYTHKVNEQTHNLTTKKATTIDTAQEGQIF